MTNEPEDNPSGGEDQDDDSADDAEQDRPTVAPPFDPVAFAQEVLGGKPSPAAGIPAVKASPGHLGPPKSSLEGAPSGRKTPLGVGAVGRPTPLGVGRPPLPTYSDPEELEDARLRSQASEPVHGGTARPTPKGLLSLANARIPSNLPPRKQSTNSFAAVDREWEELATSPPPAMQQDLIDAISRGDAPPSTKDAPDLAALAAQQASAARSMPPVPPTAQEMNDRVSLGDYTGALEIAEKLLDIDPDDEAIKVVAESCRGILKQMYTARIGPLDRVPLVMVARDQLRWLSIDHRAGFVLSLVDGVSSLEMILDVSGMPELDALRILSELAQQRIISFR
ncbi:MAG: hypothetical protein QOI41_5273 [Myxococcales bacterium]|nr:hypothetical protein [Myxococcales bacterium]